MATMIAGELVCRRKKEEESEVMDLPDAGEVSGYV